MEHDVSHLPRSAQLLVALIGLPVTMLLVDKFGGKDVRLYKGGDSLARLANKIGAEAAGKLFDHFGSDQFNVPKCDDALKVVRNARIHAEYDRMTGAERRSDRDAVHRLVDAFGLGERQVRRILKKPGGHTPRAARTASVDPRQLSLL